MAECESTSNKEERVEWATSRFGREGANSASCYSPAIAIERSLVHLSLDLSRSSDDELPHQSDFLSFAIGLSDQSGGAIPLSLPAESSGLNGQRCD